MPTTFGVVVNYFSKHDHPASVKHSAMFALSLLKNCPEVAEIALSDGSATRDAELERFCESLDIQYLHQGRILSFAEGYNAGVRHLNQEWIVTMASDIYVLPTTFTAIGRFIGECGQPDKIGCLIPYLSKSDLPTQQYSNSSMSRSCLSPSMTFNLNVFRKDVYEGIGGMTQDYSGNFNDFEMFLKLKERGLKVYLVGDAYAVHYGQLTLQFGSNANSETDSKNFFKKHPYLYEKDGFWNMKFNKIFESKLLKTLYFLRNLLPLQLKKKYTVFLLKVVPLLQKN